MTDTAPEAPARVDFTDEEPTPPSPGPSLGDTITLARELVRGRLAGALVGLLVAVDAVILILAGTLVRPFDRESMALLLTGVLNPVVALVGTVLGFYFGEKAAKGAP